jgi:hypothetical protein
VTGQSLFAFQLELLRDEIDEIQNKIAAYDDLSFKIKGWALTLWIGMLGYAINQRSPFLTLVLVPVLIAFWFLDAHFKSYQQRSMARMGHIERFINESIKGPVGSLAEAFEKCSFGSFVVPDPIGRQTCKVDEGFKRHYKRKTSFRRNMWIRNIRLLYLFLLGSTAVAVISMYLLGFCGKGA